MMPFHCNVGQNRNGRGGFEQIPPKATGDPTSLSCVSPVLPLTVSHRVLLQMVGVAAGLGQSGSSVQHRVSRPRVLKPVMTAEVQPVSQE